jgi:hypothetical protein
MSPSFIGSIGKHNADALLYQTDGHRGVGGRRIGLKGLMRSRNTGGHRRPPERQNLPETMAFLSFGSL